jgi:hypothetical protein
MSFAPFMVNIDEANIPVIGDFNAFDVNAKRPYRGEKRTDLAYITEFAGNDDAGQPVAKARCVGVANSTTLLRDEWKVIDSAIGVARQKRMNFVNWLISKGCVIDIPNGLGVTQYEWQNIGSLDGADISMDGLKQGDTDRVEYTSATMPLPIITKNWRLTLRYLEESRRKGMPMDTYFMSETARVVTQYVEKMAVTGVGSVKFGGDTLYGLLDSPNVEAVTSGNSVFTVAWDDATATGSGILADVRAMAQELNDNLRYGPFAMWLPQKYQLALAKDYSTEYPKTIAQRILETGIVSEIQYSDYFTQDGGKDRVVMLEAAKETIAIVRGMEFRDFEWQSLGGWAMDHKIAGIYAPLIRADAAGQYGIVKATLG